MVREFKILDGDYREWLFLDEHAGSLKYVSYCHFIQQILGKLLRSGCSIEDCKKSYKEFKLTFDRRQHYPNHDCKFESMRLKLYWLQDLPSYAILIDETKWCFPLVIDSPKKAQGLANAVIDISNYLDEILGQLQQHGDKDWDKELQKKMEMFEGRNNGEQAA